MKKDKVNININIENNLFSKNKQKCCHENEKKKDPQIQFHQNSSHPPLINEYYGEMAKKRLYDLSRQSLPINLPNFSHYNVPFQNPTTHPEPVVQVDDVTDPSEHTDFSEFNDPPQPETQEEEEILIGQPVTLADLKYQKNRDKHIERITKQGIIPSWNTIVKYNLHSFIDPNGTRPANAPMNWNLLVGESLGI